MRSAHFERGAAGPPSIDHPPRGGGRSMRIADFAPSGRQSIDHRHGNPATPAPALRSAPTRRMQADGRWS
jgi:hypothetical protein